MKARSRAIMASAHFLVGISEGIPACCAWAFARRWWREVSSDGPGWYWHHESVKDERGNTWVPCPKCWEMAEEPA